MAESGAGASDEGQPCAAPAAATPTSVAPVIPWERRKKTGLLYAYWRTVFHVIRRFGRLGIYLDSPVSYRDAQKFRWLTIAHATFLAVAFGAVRALLIGGILGSRSGVSVSGEAALIVVAGVVVLWPLSLGCMTGVVSWFFCPRAFDTERQNRSIALSYYTCAPLALSIFLVPPLLALLPFAGQVTLATAVLSVVGCVYGALHLLWLLLALFAVSYVAGRGAQGVVGAAVALSGLWAAIEFFFLLVLPVGIMMLVLMFGSLD